MAFPFLIAGAALVGLNLFAGYSKLRAEEGVKRVERRLLDQSLSFQRFEAERGFSQQFRTLSGAQQAALGAGRIAGGQTARLFALDTQLQLLSARSSLDRQQLETRIQSELNLGAAKDKTRQGLAQGLLNSAGTGLSLFRDPLAERIVPSSLTTVFGPRG